MRAFLIFLAISLAALTAPAAAITTYVVLNGSASSQAMLAGTWTTTAGALTGTGTSTTVTSKVGVGPGDFEIRATLVSTAAAPVRAALLVDEVADFGLADTSTGKIYVRGFFFGDMTQDLANLSSVWTPGTDAVMVIKRVGDIVDCSINGVSFWNVPYESARPFGKIGIRAGSNTIGIKSFYFDGAQESLTGWVSPYDRVYPFLPGSLDVFTGGVGGYNTYRIPSIVRTNAGTLVAICEGRKTSASDSGDIDLVVKRSTDGGATWGTQILAYEEGGTATITIGNPCPVVDRSTGTMWLMFCRNNLTSYIGKSLDDGVTWQPRVEITSQMKPPNSNGSIYSGPGHGFQTTAGRLCFPCYHGTAAGGSSYMTYSDDGGVSFTYGADVGLGSGEPSGVQLSDGTVMMNSRAPRRVWKRITAISPDYGATWGTAAYRPELIEPTCEGSIIGSLGGGDLRTLVFANPFSYRRERATVQLSMDDGATWTDSIRVYDGSSAYSDLVQVDGKNMALLFERSNYDAISFSPFSLDDFPTHSEASAANGPSWIFN